MNLKEFFWAPKEKLLLTLGLFVLANILFFPAVVNTTYCELWDEKTGLKHESSICPPETRVMSILTFFEIYLDYFVSIEFAYEIVYLGFSFLVACFVFYIEQKVPK